MVDTPRVAWVKPAPPIQGLDHLAVQAPCTAIYTYLLPGITNASQRARYFSFHPWLLWSFERRYRDRSLEACRRVLRRAECLFALSAIRHSSVLQDGEEWRHGAGMSGRQKLRVIDEGEQIRLDDYAALDGQDRYLKNPWGGLGQVYFGPLRELRVLDHSEHGPSHPPGYDRERGKALAEAFAREVPEDEFFKLLEASVLDWSDLDALQAFCPCALLESKVELGLLSDLFFARTATFEQEGAATRRASLACLLDLASRSAEPENSAFENLLRGAAYTRALPDGSPWDVPPSFQGAQRGWGTYQRNELLSLAVQGLFAAVLTAINRDRGGVIQRSADAGPIALGLIATSPLDPAQLLTEAVATARTRLPALALWRDDRHELQLAWQLHGLGRELPEADPKSLAVVSLEILIALLARGMTEDPYGDIERDPDSFDANEIHLASFLTAWRTTWAEMTIGEWVRWLAVEWGVTRHLRVALRKLRGEQRDTFRIRPLEHELRVVEVPPPVFTLPRLGSAQQILLDLGLFEILENRATGLTERGRQELKACNVG